MTGDAEVIADPDRLANLIRSDTMMEWMAYFKIDTDRQRGEQLEAGAREKAKDMKAHAEHHVRKRR